MLEWYALHYRQYRHDILKHELNSRGIDYYDPHIWIDQRGKKILKPLFPTYMFLHLDVGRDYHSLRYARGVLYVLPKDSPPASIRDDHIEWLKQRVEMHNRADINPTKEGHQVIANNGPLQSLEGIFQEHSSNGRCRILLNLLGGNRSVEVNVVD